MKFLPVHPWASEFGDESVLFEPGVDPGKTGISLDGGAFVADLAAVPANFIACLAGAAAPAVAVVEILDATDAETALLEPHVQSQEDGEAAYAEAQRSGAWDEGALIAWVADAQAKVEVLSQHPDQAGVVAYLEQGIADAQARIEVIPLVIEHQNAEDDQGRADAAASIADKGFTIEVAPNGGFSLTATPLEVAALPADPPVDEAAS